MTARPRRAQSSSPIRIGEVNSYSAQPAFTLPYRNGMEFAADELNAASGVLGRKLELLTRNDAGRPQDAVRLAGELLSDQKVSFLAGSYLSNVGLALADYALQNRPVRRRRAAQRRPNVGKGNRYTYRLRSSTSMQAAMLVPDAAKLPAKRWAAVAPNYEYGQSAINGSRRSCSPSARISSSSAGSGRHWAASTPVSPCMRWPRPTRKRSSTPLPPPTSPISSAPLTPAACSRNALSSRCSPGNPNT